MELNQVTNDSDWERNVVKKCKAEQILLIRYTNFSEDVFNLWLAEKSRRKSHIGPMRMAFILSKRSDWLATGSSQNAISLVESLST